MSALRQALIATAQDLASEDGDNREYDRALVELIVNATITEGEDSETLRTAVAEQVVVNPCEGHEPDPGRPDQPMGVEVYCDGSCRS